MKTGTRLLLSFFAIFISLSAVAQLQRVYIFQKDDSLLKIKYYEQALQKKNSLVSSLGKEYKDDYKKIYENRFKEAGRLLLSSRAVTAPEAHDYLQTVVQKIISVNEELKGIDTRIIFSRDWWPNAYSMGEGTFAVNAGLMIFLDNEAELVFVLCHELAHYYLDHSNKAIKKNVEIINSDSLKNEIKKLSKLEFRAGQQFEALLKTLVFGSRQHSRENEAEADRQALRFMKNTGYDCGAIKTALQMLDQVDDSLFFKPLDLEQVFNFPEYPFKKKWVQKESSLFSAMTEDDSPLTKKERDSMKTHPDCSKRIALLNDSINALPSTGKKFLVSEKLFNQLKKEFYVEMAEQEYRDKNLSRHLYYNLLLLQKQENIPVAVYSIARCLNQIYEKQKAHTLGPMLDAETRGYPADYNLLLRMINRLKLEDIAELNYNFCRQYDLQMKDYAGFTEEINKSQKIKNHQE